MPVYSLGAHSFINANVEGVRGGLPPVPQEMVEVLGAAVGIDGEAIRNLGVRGETFRYMTVAYLDSAALALARFSLYSATPGNVPQNVVWEGVDYDTVSVRYCVQRVVDMDIRLTSSLIVDGTVLGTKYLLSATWILHPVVM